MTTAPSIHYKTLMPKDFKAVIELANIVHGDGYLNDESMVTWYQKGLIKESNTSFVAYDNSVTPSKLIGFRITFAQENWLLDQWVNPSLWQVSPEKVAYFKCNTVDENYRGHGIGGHLLKLSIESLRQQGAQAGVSHLWCQSPNNSAVRYFTKCGGQLIKIHQKKWQEDCDNGYECILCGFECHCEAAEMIIYFD